MSDTYKIKPLAWKGSDERGWSAQTPFGSYGIGRHWSGAETGTLQEDPLYWSYCFDEYYDEGRTDCDSIEEGKRLAESHWRDRLSSALEEVQK